MKPYQIVATLALPLFSLTATAQAAGIACPFNNAITCTIERDILNDKGSNGLKYYAATNYDHRISGEIEVYNATLVSAYTDSVNAPGQIKFLLNKTSGGLWQAGEFMTRANLNSAPFNSPTASNPWTTKEIQHGYLEVIAKFPKCDTSGDGLCQAGTNPLTYNQGLWPAIWLLPTMDANWPTNGEIDISEAYLQGTNFIESTATLHFNGTSSACQNGDCVGDGYHLGFGNAATPLYNAFHIWGFEWQPDPASKDGGQLLTGYFDGVKTWGPLATDSLPADGKNAFSRGFNDPNGGYYLIMNLALGGGYAGNPNAELQTANMYVQSAKAYTVTNTPPTVPCNPPINVQSMYSPDKKQVTIAWEQATTTAPVVNYQVNNWQGQLIWKGTSPTQRSFQDQTLPGTSGNFVYNILSTCTTGNSTPVNYTVVIPVAK